MLNESVDFRMLIVVLFCIDNVDNALNININFLIIEIFAQTMRSVNDLTVITVIIIVLIITVTISLLAASF
jgi:hypothetical protein